MEIQTITWLMYAALAVAMPLRADVHATLSQSSIAQNEPFTLTLESDTRTAGPPDLSPLEQDFRVVRHSTSRSMRSFNGRRSQRTAITLTLMPRRGGELIIPAIDFGLERSQALQISVTPTADTGLNSGFPDTRAPGSMESAPFPFPPPQQGFSQGFSGASPFSTPQDRDGIQGMPEWSGLPGLNGAGFGMPVWTVPADIKDPPAQPETIAPVVPEERGAAYWPWITGLLLVGWIITMLLLGWRTRRAPNRPKTAESGPVAPVEDLQQEAADALDEVRRAYEHNDTLAAKTALLRWATTQWPANPPTNLSRLAARCPATVQRRILKLDESLYSPEPIPWNDEPVWEQLGDLDQNGPDQSAPAAGLAHSGS